MNDIVETTRVALSIGSNGAVSPIRKRKQTIQFSPDTTMRQRGRTGQSRVLPNRFFIEISDTSEEEEQEEAVDDMLLEVANMYVKLTSLSLVVM